MTEKEKTMQIRILETFVFYFQDYIPQKITFSEVNGKIAATFIDKEGTKFGAILEEIKKS